MVTLTNLSQHSVVFLLLLLICHSFAFPRRPCQDDDFSSLLQFKHSFVFDESRCDPSANYTKLTSWEVGEDCCLWDGIDCDVETGHVIGIDLSSSCLHGSINSSSPLFRLVHLKSLDLSYNNFNRSTIPGGVRSLRQLTDLNLNYSNFVGQIPSEILQLSNLVSLDLSRNFLMLEKPSLKDVVDSFTQLSKLHLSFVAISSHVPHSLSDLTSLSSLLLQNCLLLGEFPPRVFLLPNLRFLSLVDNPNLSGYLPEYHNVSSPLQELWLDGTNFSGQLPASIGNLKSLRVLSAGGCYFRGVIPSSLGNLTNLYGLELSENYFLGEIPSALGNLVRLTYLGLQSLSMQRTSSFETIPSSFQNLTRLATLQLDSNQLTGQIPSWLGNFTRLTGLSFSRNQLQGQIPEAIFRLPDLQVLNLGSNNLSGTLKYDSFLQMQHLSQLQLTNNRLSVVRSPYINVTLPKLKLLGLGGCDLREFPAFLKWQNELEYLTLRNNKIKGYVPGWLSNLESLTVLDLQNNSLTGFENPLCILSLPNLSMLNLNDNQFKGPLPLPSQFVVDYDVSQNRFSGHISSLFCNLTSALTLDLSSNNLSGTLPPCFGDVATVLNLRNNSLSGSIPDRFTSSCKLKVMDFSQNKFVGEVPNSLANCSELEILNLDENRMNGVFPSWLGFLPYIRVLSLRSNNFQGTIGKPLTKFDFSRLQIIDLSGNNFTGKLPLSYFRNWVAMKNVDKDQLAYMQANTSFEIPGYYWISNYNYTIRIVNKGTDREYERILEFFVVVDLSSNRFEGEIPEIVGTLRALQSLNLSNNMLTGHIPSSLGNLTVIEALDLSRNNLSGQIPSKLTSVTSLAIFNVSHNSLTGPVPRGNQFDTFDNSSFSANPGLCGDILSKKCGKMETLTPSESDEGDDESPFQFNWEILLIGCGTGLVIGVAFGCALDTQKYEWLVKKKFARRVRRGCRN